jgi:queuosine precursor transporter
MQPDLLPRETANPISPAAQTNAPTHFSKSQLLYVWLAAFSVTCLLVADLVGVKLFQFNLPFPILGKTTIEHTCGMLTFPITFLITDWLNDYFGKAAARRVVLISFSMGMFAFIIMRLASAMPAWDVPFNIQESAFQAVFSNASIMFVASLCAYLVASFADIYLFKLLKRATGGSKIWLRATGSTVISQLIDSFIVTYLAFSLGRLLFPQEGGPAPMPMSQVLATAATGYTLKFIIAVCLTPVLYAGHSFIHKATGLKPLKPE